MDLELCKLTKEEVVLTRPLYEEVFSEDTQSFVDYYYDVKAPLCVAFVWKNQQGEIVSMLHLDPYTLCVKTDQGTEQVPTYYVVCVATRESYRHQGCMAGLLCEAEAYCRKRQVPFLFLMPADPNIYEPFGYQFLYERKEYYVNYFEGEFCGDRNKKLPENVDVLRVYATDDEIFFCNIYHSKLKLCKQNTGEMKSNNFGEDETNEQINEKINEKGREKTKEKKINVELCKLADFANQWLFEKKDYYLRRDEAYYVNLLKELAAQKGCIYVFFLGGQVEGYYAQTKEAESNMGCGRDGIQEAMLSDHLIAAFEKAGRKRPILASNHTTPVIMGKCLGSEGERLRPFLWGNKRGFLTELI